MDKCNLSDVTFVFPLRIDCKEREENLRTVVSLLKRNTDATILIFEADNTQKFHMEEDSQIKLLFTYDVDPIFHRTKYLNNLLSLSKTPIVGIWDTDVVLPILQIENAVKAIRNKTAIMSFPYDGRFLSTRPEVATKFIETTDLHILEDSFLLYGKFAVGGAFLVDKKVYLQSGGENEYLYGWGPEDAERVKRMEILDLPIYRASGPLYHLYHPRGDNSHFFNEERRIANLKELLKICAMNKKELKSYISTWASTIE